jgi:hypothetical protein
VADEIESTPTDWDRLIAEYPDTIVLSVELGIMTQAEADAEEASFQDAPLDQRQRAILRERWRQVDALEVNGQISAEESAETRRALLDDGANLGFGEPPW